MTTFSLIGGSIWVMGLAMQLLLTGKWHIPAEASYFIQAVISVETSFVLNRWLTWPDRGVGFWPALARFNLQKSVTMALNLAAYAGLVRLGTNYLLANTILAAVFTVVNYTAGDLLVFTRLRGTHRTSAARSGSALTREQAVPAVPLAAMMVAAPVSLIWCPTVSVVIPCKASQRTIRATVLAMLAQDYPNLVEVICVGDVDDQTWTALDYLADERLIMIDYAPNTGRRDPNAKRDLGIQKSTGELIALADSDIIMDPGWLSRAVALLADQGRQGLVAGGMRSVHDSFWGTFVDYNQLAAKTPRLPRPYQVTADNFGRRGFKPPVTANALFTRELYDRTPLDATWFFGYEDYEWFWRVVRDGHSVLFSGELTAAHHHRGSFRALVREYRQSARGCAKFVRTHPDSPLARKRLVQAVALPLALIAVLAAAGVALAQGQLLPLLAMVAGAWALLAGREAVRSRRVEALMYPIVALPLGVTYTLTLGRGLVSTRPEQSRPEQSRPEQSRPEQSRFSGPDAVGDSRPPWTRRPVYWPLVAVLAVQAVFSLSLVWSNTAFSDEANYLWQGRLVWAHWLHGAPLPPLHDSGTPLIYPPIGAIASAVGGLAAARILSMCFMLAGTVMLYQIGRALFGRRAAVAGVALWAVSEPVLRLAFATYDALACALVIASLWLAVQAGRSRKRGELVALAALVLALGSATAFSFAIYVPAVVGIAFLIWVELLGPRLAIWCASWLACGTVLAFVGVLTFTHGWANFVGSTINRAGTGGLGAGVSAVVRSGWSWDGVIVAIAAAGVAAAFHFERLTHRRLLVLALALSGLLVVAYQAHLGTGWAMDKHMTTGTGFMALAAGYGLSSFRLPWRHAAAWSVSAALISYPAFTGLWYARSTFRSWPNTGALASYLKARPAPNAYLIAGRPGGSGVTGLLYSMYYYLPKVPITRSHSPSSITSGSYATVILVLRGTLSSQASAKASILNSELLHLASGTNAGVDQLAAELEHNGTYKLATVFTYTTSFNGPGVFAVWQRTAPAK